MKQAALIRRSVPPAPAVLAALAFTALSAAVAPSPAHAWWRGGVAIGIAPPPLYFGPPVYAPPLYAPPVYYPPPVYYAPPPFYVAPPRRLAQSCYAGAYVCPLPQPGPVGGACSCPAFHGRVYGRAG